jgi:DnaJ-class molecular chaperone
VLLVFGFVTFSSTFSSCEKSTNVFKEFKLTQKSTTEQIQKGYRELALKYHPDSGHAPNSEEFIRVTELRESLLAKHKHDILYYYDFFGPSQIDICTLKIDSM